MIRRIGFIASGFLSVVGILLAGLVTRSQAQWSHPFRTLARGIIAHAIQNKGMGGRRDNGKKQEPSGFSYPMNKSTLVYSGGKERVGWNDKAHSCEGVWIMSKTGGVVANAYAGTNQESSDIVSMDHDASTYPEAYLGGIHNGGWALSVHSNGGGFPSSWVRYGNFRNIATNYWPPSPDGVVTGYKTPSTHPVMIWNYRYNEYPPRASFTERIAAGDLPQLSAPAWAEALAEDDFPETVSIARAYSTANNLEWTRKYYQFGNDNYDDFIICDTMVENIGSAAAEGVYIAVKNRFHNGFAWWINGTPSFNNIPGNRITADDWHRSTLAPNYLDGGANLGTSKPAGSALGKQLADQGHAMLYCHDGEQQDPSFPHNDWGDPILKKLAWNRIVTDQQWVNEGCFGHGDYFGVGVVDAFPPFNTYGGLDAETYVAPHDNPETTDIDESVQQPASATIWKFVNHGNFEQPDPDNNSDNQIYDILTTAGYHNEPGEADHYSEFMTFGPYTLQPGEKCKVVIAWAGGVGGNNAKYSDYKKYGKPFELAWLNMYNGPGNPPVDYQTRQQELAWGEQAMFEHFQKAIEAYNWGYDVPNQPPTIRLSKRSNLKGQNEISWSAYGEDAEDPDYTGAEAKDLRGYRIYRASVQNDGPYELAAEFTIADAKAGKLPPNVTYEPDGVHHTVASSSYPEGLPLMSNRMVHAAEPDAGTPVKGVYRFADVQSRAGFPNWYFVRYYDSGHADWKGQGAVPAMESGPGPGATGICGYVGGVVPVVPADDAFNTFQEKVAVVPNPFKQDEATRSYKMQQKIRFINLPSRCQINIYDVTGQKVWTQFLNDLTIGESTWNQFTEGRPSDFGQAVFPGIYFWKVTNLMPEPEAGGAKWKFQRGTILIMK